MDSSTALPAQPGRRTWTRGRIISDVLLALSVGCVAWPLAAELPGCHDHARYENALLATALFVIFVGTVLVSEEKFRLRGTMLGLNLRSAVIPHAVMTSMLIDRILR